MTVIEAAKLLEVQPSTVYALCAARRLGHSRYGLGKGTIRIEPADLDAYMRSSRVEAVGVGGDDQVDDKPAPTRSREPVLAYQLEIDRMRESRRQAKRGRA
jgi:excisionase family DNA binding protein